MPLNHWDLVLNDTNTMEGSHADDNHIHGINHTLADAIMVDVFTFMYLMITTTQLVISAQKADAEKAKQFLLLVAFCQTITMIIKISF